MSQETQSSPNGALKSTIGPILIVEDNDDLRTFYEIFFADKSVVTYLARDPDEAMTMYADTTARGRPPKVALVDFVYKGSSKSGVSLIADLRAVDHDLVIITMTGYSGLAKESVALKQGADYFLTKPIQPPEKLLFYILTAIEKRRVTGQAGFSDTPATKDGKHSFLTFSGKETIVCILIFLCFMFAVVNSVWQWNVSSAMKSNQDDIKVLRIDLNKQAREKEALSLKLDDANRKLDNLTRERK